jgi:hypothetical protein
MLASIIFKTGRESLQLDSGEFLSRLARLHVKDPEECLIVETWNLL